MKFELVTALTQFRELEDEWRTLFANADQRNNIFASFEWHAALLATYEKDYTSGRHNLSIVVGRKKGRARLICPLVQVRSFGAKVLNWIGSPVSQYGDVIADMGKQQPYLIDAALKFALDETGADALVLENVRDGSAAAVALQTIGASQFRQRSAPSTNLEAFESAKSFSDSLTASRRKKHRRLTKRLSELGPVKFELLSPGPQAERRTRQALDLKRTTLEQQGTFSRAFSDEKFEQFFEQVAAYENANVGFTIGTLSVDDRLIAAEIGFKTQNTYVAHIGVYDSNYKKYAPGHLLIERMLGECINAHILSYDFLAPEDEYKQSWSTHSTTVTDFCLSKNAIGRAYCHALKISTPAAKVLKKVLPQAVLRLVATK